MKRVLLCGAAAVVLSAAAAPVASATHAWGTYHWARTAMPFTLKVGDNVTAAWDSYFATSNSDWSKSADLELVPVAGTSNKRCSMTAGTTQVCNGTYGKNGWLGLATINLTAGHISQGSAKMNDTYFNTATYNNPNERQHVLCQEVGHTLGLTHTSEDGSSQDTCMDYFSNTGANATSTLSTRPNQHDYDQLAAIYGHLDATSTLAASATSSPGMAGRENAQPYRSTRRDSARHTQIVEEFADGTVRVTDVRWAGAPRTVVDRG